MKKQLIGQIQRPGERPQNVQLVLDDPTQLIQPFVDGDTTPSVLRTDGNTLFTTANTSGTTITDIDDGLVGQVVDIVIGDAYTTVDFTSTNLKNKYGLDWSPANGDHMRCVYDGSTWYCTTFEKSVIGSSEVNVQNGNYTTVLSDANDTISKESGGDGETFTIDSNANVAHVIGTFIGFNNDGGGDLTIAITTDTLIWADDNSTGSRTIADGGYAVAHKVAATTWKIAGKQIT